MVLLEIVLGINVVLLEIVLEINATLLKIVLAIVGDLLAIKSGDLLEIPCHFLVFS